MRVVLNKVFLQYPAAGTPVNEFRSVHKNDAHKFVALDSASGGYPYSVEIDRACDFKTVQEAKKYAQHEPFLVREVTVTYDF